MRLKILGIETALPTTANTATTVGGATELRLIHDAQSNATHLVTILNNASPAVAVGSFSITPGTSLVIRKDTSFKVYASNAEVRVVAVSYQS